jgi:3D (Asp-Asp-Asp) domain-containing protein
MTRLTQIRILIFILGISLVQCDDADEKWEWKTIKVTATAYNSLAAQTKPKANIAAWGDTLRPGMKCVAVSSDLLRKGLKYNTPLKIEGFEGVFLVKDKMNERWENRIDIYMGLDVEKAKEWGRKKVTIQYGVAIKEPNQTETK